METTNREKLITDLKVVLSDAEGLLRAAATTTGEKATELRDRAASTLKRASERLVDFQDGAIERSKAAALAADDFVHDKPWTAVGIAAAIGFVLGLIVNRR